MNRPYWWPHEKRKPGGPMRCYRESDIAQSYRRGWNEANEAIWEALIEQIAELGDDTLALTIKASLGIPWEEEDEVEP